MRLHRLDAEVQTRGDGFVTVPLGQKLHDLTLTGAAPSKAGNPRARRVLIEGAWTYRYPARLSRPLQVRQESLPTVVRAIAWKAQLRLCARYRRLMAAGKRQTVVTTAIAREMAAFLWAIGHAVEPRPAA